MPGQVWIKSGLEFQVTFAVARHKLAIKNEKNVSYKLNLFVLYFKRAHLYTVGLYKS